MTIQDNIDKPTKDIVAQALQDLCKSEPVNMAINSYRKAQKEMAQSEASNLLDEFITEFAKQPEYQKWLAAELKRDERRRKKKIPTGDLERVKLYITLMKSNLPAAIPTTWFTESTDRWGRKGLWRLQANGYLTGLAVLDADHVPDPETLVKGWLGREDFGQLGILWIFITPSGQGVKVVFKARQEWGNLIDNAYAMAELLGVLDYADSQCKNSDHAHFIPRFDDIKFVDWEELFSYRCPDYEAVYGEAYRRGESGPTQPRWQELELQRKKTRASKATKTSVAPAKTPVTQATASGNIQAENLTEREKAIIAALNEYYGETVAEGRRHETWLSETAQWLLLLLDNSAEKALRTGRELNWVKNWTDMTVNELENCIATVQSKPKLTRRPKKLTELLSKAGIDTDSDSDKKAGTGEYDDLPFEEWIERIRALFDVFPCIREICEPHPERLWPFLLFASAALLGTEMTLTWYYFYDQPELKRRLNYNVLGIGHPASGKGALVRISDLLTEPMGQADQLANDAINNWKENQMSKGANKDKTVKPKNIVRLHGARTSNNVFINDMVNAWTEVDGERVQMHMLTVDTEALNSIKMQKGGGWIDKQIMEIKAFSNEKDSQQYANLDSVTGFFDVMWNLVRTCTPPALHMLVNEQNFGSGYPLRVAAIPVPGTSFKMIPLLKKSRKAEEADETLRMWAYRLDKRQGELPLWPLVEHCWQWTSDRMEIAAFNNDQADEMLLKRCAYYGITISTPFIDMRHWDEREKTGTYEIDDTDKELCDLALDIQYRTQHYYFGELARNYFDEQMKDATRFRRRTTRYGQCFMQLQNEFTTEQFSKVFGFANNRSANKALNRLLADKSIERTKRGEYRKRVQNIL